MNACLRDLSKTVKWSVPRRARPLRHQGALLPHAERRDAHGCGVRRTLPGPDLRQRPYELDARRRVSVRRAGGDRGRYRRHDHRRRLAAHGFPRQASIAVEIGGVRTNFRMPDVFRSAWAAARWWSRTSRAATTVGPRSVGYRLTSDALIFGGKILTTSDLIVAAGRADFGDRSKVADLPPALVTKTRARNPRDGGERRRALAAQPEPLPVIVVGGGSILVDDRIGDLEVVKPHHFACANAVGAAIAQVSGEVDRIYMLSKSSRDEALADAKRQASDAAIAASARANSVAIVDVEDVPLTYLPGNATRTSGQGGG